ncbi:nucleotidyltransferase domain-containing protein [Halarchaeum acidiphilum]|nr:nucleotidyltransferase domain-containing protein [Halarchaeum acidiphilum]
MSETADEALSDGAHETAASTFVERARSRHGDDVAELYVFGSTVRSEASGRSSDVDVLVVLRDDVEHDAVADSLRDIAYDVMLEYGPLVELHILSESTFERYRDEGNPFVRNVVAEGRAYA